MADATGTVTNAEAELYDRQIRLWGLEAQSRVRNAKVLIVGMRGLHAEACKNLVLAGVNITIQDSECVTSSDLASQFFLKPSDVGKNRAEASLSGIQELNPFATVCCVTEPIDDQKDKYFQQFQVVAMHGGSLKSQERVSRICHAHAIAFYVSENSGFLGLICADLHGREYVNVAHGGTVTSKEPICLEYPSFQQLTAESHWGRIHEQLRWGLPPLVLAILAWKRVDAALRGDGQTTNDDNEASRAAAVEGLLRDRGLSQAPLISSVVALAERVASCAGCDLTPVCAVLGGVLGQDIVKAISRHNEPINNTMTFNGLTGEGIITLMHEPSKQRALKKSKGSKAASSARPAMEVDVEVL